MLNRYPFSHVIYIYLHTPKIHRVLEIDSTILNSPNRLNQSSLHTTNRIISFKALIRILSHNGKNRSLIEWVFFGWLVYKGGQIWPSFTILYAWMWVSGISYHTLMLWVIYTRFSINSRVEILNLGVYLKELWVNSGVFMVRFQVSIVFDMFDICKDPDKGNR